MSRSSGAASWQRRTTWPLRLLGVGLLVGLIARIDVNQVYAVVRAADVRPVAVSILAIIPLMFVKTLRWQRILRSQAIEFRLARAFRAYLGSLFVTSLTVTALGEVARALFVIREGGAPSARAFSSVLADRLFDLYTLLAVAGFGLLRLMAGGAGRLELALFMILLTVPLIVLLNARTFGWLRQLSLAVGGPAGRFAAHGSWISELRAGLQALRWQQVIVAAGLTLTAYAVFFSQCYLLALALGLPADLPAISVAVALGNLATMLPISISGLGTREAAVVGYLLPMGVPSEAALAFSLLVFFTFHLGGGLMGAVAWWLRPR